MDRREFLRTLTGATLGAATGSSLWTRAAYAACAGGAGPYGPLLAPDALGLQLPAGFQARIVARGNQTVPGTSFTWHRAADGGAVLPAAGGYVYVSNAEIAAGEGGASAIRFDYRGRILDAYSICDGTSRNCAGGATPWGTWLSCEETPIGRVWECDPGGGQPAVVRPAMGTFRHEAVASDPLERRLYLTEDDPAGLFYRFTPGGWGDLSSGLLEAMEVDADGRVTWHGVPDPDGSPIATRNQVPAATPFARGEGCIFSHGHVFFTTTGDGKVHDYDPVAETLSLLYDDDLDPLTQLSDPDNIGAARSGDLVVAEDSGNLEIVLIGHECTASPLVRITGQLGTEVTGPAFDPLGRRLYFSSQRGGASRDGITYEVEGPFRRS